MKKSWTIARKNKIILAILIIVLGSLASYLVYDRENQALPQAAIYFLDNVKLPEKNQKVLVFSPHPDDESIGAGGYIFDSERNGAQVRIILVTDGNKHDLKDRRYLEFEQATAILGVKKEDLTFLNYPDDQLKETNQTELITKFQDIIDQFNPDIIVYSSSRDRHPDHATTGKAVETVLKNENSQKIAYAYLVHERRWPQPKKRAFNLYLLPPVKLVNFDDQWQKLMVDGTTMTKKQAAIMVYQSQIREPFLRSLMFSSIRQNELFAVEKRQ